MKREDGMDDDGRVADRVLALLRQQRDRYQDLKGLASRQRILVTSGEPERLLGVLTERRKHVDRLGELDNEVRRLSRRWPDLYRAMDPGQRRDADGLIEEVRRTLQEILASDEEDARLLSARMAGVRQQSDGLAESRRAYAAYGTAALQAARDRGQMDGGIMDAMDEEA